MPNSLDEEIEAAVQLKKIKEIQKKKQTEEVEILEKMYGLPSPEESITVRKTRIDLERKHIQSQAGSAPIPGNTLSHPQGPSEDKPQDTEDQDKESEEDQEENQQEPEEDKENENDDEHKKEELEAVNQEQRQQQAQAQAGEGGEAMGAVKKVQKLAKWGKRLMWVVEFLGATFPIWGPILLTLFIAVTFVGGCNNSITFRIASLGACEPFIIDGTFSGGRSGGAGGGASFWEPADLIALSGVSIDDQTSDPRVRSCMLAKVQQIFSAAQAAGLQITITSAFRSGDFPSRHAFGEAVDISLRPLPSQPWRTNSRIAQLVQIAKNAGFNPPTGDTLDEYNRPVERTSGGHVHVEFNKISTSGSHCAPYPNPPAPV